jgi:hypothetical protein
VMSGVNPTLVPRAEPAPRVRKERTA